jgi:hypothetical protein
MVSSYCGSGVCEGYHRGHPESDNCNLKHSAKLSEVIMSPTDLEKFKAQALEAFFLGCKKDHGDIKTETYGELNECSHDDISFSYGNGELFASNDKMHLTFVCDTYGDANYLELVDWEIE